MSVGRQELLSQFIWTASSLCLIRVVDCLVVNHTTRALPFDIMAVAQPSQQGSEKDAETRHYDRQIRLWGVETQERLNQTRVLIIGLTLTNMEACKNLLLSGIQLSICEGPTQLKGSTVAPKQETTDASFAASLHPSHWHYQFLLTDEQRSSSDSTVSAETLIVEALQKLNPFASVNTYPFSELQGFLGAANEDVEGRSTLCAEWFPFSAVIVATEGLSRDFLEKINRLCRKLSKGFFMTRSVGLNGAIFSDFGAAFPPTPKNAETCSSHSPAQILSSPALCDVLKLSPKSLPSGYSSSRKTRLPNLSLLFFFALLLHDNHASEKNGASFDQFMEAFMAEAGYDVNEEKKNPSWKEWGRSDGTAFPSSAAIVGGLLAQEVHKFIVAKPTDIRNVIVFNNATSEGVALPVGISKSA